jgi:peptide/nickel transport system substrate-binding protein
LAAACSDDKKSSGAASGSGSPASSSEAPKPDGCFSSTGKVCATSKLAGKPAKMTVTYDIDPAANWSDNTPITYADFQCMADAALDTPGSIQSTGYDRMVSVEKGTSDKQVVVSFDQPYAPYKNMFGQGMFQKAAVANCQDISADFQDNLGPSGRPWKLDSFTKDQEVLVPNDTYWSEKPQSKKVVFNPVDAGDTEVTDLKTGGHDFIFPQPYAGYDAAIQDPNVDSVPGSGLQYEDLYFQQKTGPFADATFRKAFMKSIDKQAVFDQIYKAIFPQGTPLNCMYWVPKVGTWCSGEAWGNTFDQAGADKLLTDAGWTKNGDGLWAKDGNAPTLRWLTNGNTRRSDMQDFLIPKLKTAGFNVVKDNCDSACVFQKRIPALDYEITMYISQVTPDPSVTNIASCEQVPSDANGNKGQNTVGWCNEAATKLMHDSDAELDDTKRVDLIHQIDKLATDDAIGLPLFQFPNIAAWRTDRLSGPVSDDTANYRAFANQLFRWKTNSADGIIKFGSEQWPDCLNPITDCSQSSWAVWMGAWNVLPNAFDTTADGKYVKSPLLVSEPKVAVL